MRRAPERIRQIEYCGRTIEVCFCTWLEQGTEGEEMQCGRIIEIVYKCRDITRLVDADRVLAYVV